MEYADTFPSQCYANRELSWLQFNQRILEEVAGKLKLVDPASDVIGEARLLGISFGDD